MKITKKEEFNIKVSKQELLDITFAVKKAINLFMDGSENKTKYEALVDELTKTI